MISLADLINGETFQSFLSFLLSFFLFFVLFYRRFNENIAGNISSLDANIRISKATTHLSSVASVND